MFSEGTLFDPHLRYLNGMDIEYSHFMLLYIATHTKLFQKRTKAWWHFKTIFRRRQEKLRPWKLPPCLCLFWSNFSPKCGTLVDFLVLYKYSTTTIVLFTPVHLFISCSYWFSEKNTHNKLIKYYTLLKIKPMVPSMFGFLTKK